MISIIVTCFNESEIINEFIIALNKEISKINEKFEVIFVDNKSSDNTLEIIKNNIGLFNNYKIIILSNYFGKESGILAGLDNSGGDAIIIMDPDLEDPPEMIKDFILNNIHFITHISILNTLFLNHGFPLLFFFFLKLYLIKN